MQSHCTILCIDYWRIIDKFPCFSARTWSATSRVWLTESRWINGVGNVTSNRFLRLVSFPYSKWSWEQLKDRVWKPPKLTNFSCHFYLIIDLGNTFFLATQKTEKLVDYARMRNCLQKRELCLLNHPENEVRAATAKQRKSLFNQQQSLNQFSLQERWPTQNFRRWAVFNGHVCAWFGQCNPFPHTR